MEIGLSTACFYPMQTEDTIRVISDLGAPLCEVFFEADCECDLSFARLLKERMEERGVRAVSAHAFCIPFEHQLFADYQRRIDDALVSYRRVLAAASAIGARYYTFHGDKRSERLDGLDYKHLGRCFDALLNMADAYGVSLAWENVAWCQSSRPEHIANIKNAVSRDGLKFTLDIKQANRAGVPVDEYIKVMGSDIANLHINDFDAHATCLLPGKGVFDFAELFAKLGSAGYRGDAIVEVYSENYTDISQLADSIAYVKSCLAQT